MPPLDLPTQVQQLRDLAEEFETLHVRVRQVSYTPGTNALRQITPLLLKTQDLTATALLRLAALDNSAYTSIAGSRAGLETLSSVVAAASLAGTDLASALYANPYEGAPFAGYPADDALVRTARDAEAIARMTGHLEDAAHQLDLGAIACRYAASSITRGLAAAHPPQAAQHQTMPKLNSAQYTALTSLAQGAGRLYESEQRGLGVTRVATTDGTRISIATFRALATRGLVSADTSTVLLVGQKITVTEQGQQALAQGRPASVTTTTPAPAPKTSVMQGVRR